MLVVNQSLAKQFGMLVLKKFNVQGKTGSYEVELLENGKMRCNCIAGSMGKECRHQRIIRNQLNGEKYEQVNR